MRTLTGRVQGGGGGRGAGVVAVLEHHERLIAAGEMPRPDFEVGTSIGAWHALACAAGRPDLLRPMYETLRGKRDVMPLDWNPIGGFGADLEAMIELAAREGLGEGLKVPTWLGVVNMAGLGVVTGPEALAGHFLVRVDDLTPDQARVWAARSSCQRPAMKPVRRKAQYIDGGWRAVVPPLPPEVAAKTARLLVVACSPLDPAARTAPLEPADLDGPFECFGVLMDDVIDQAAYRDLQRLALYAGRGIDVRVWSPPTMAEVGRTFDLRPETIARRLNVVGPRAVANVRRVRQDGALVPVPG